MKAFAFRLIGRWQNIPVSATVALAGMGLISYGVTFFSLAAGLIVGGVLLVLAAMDMRF
jgi:hypothetical protein